MSRQEVGGRGETQGLGKTQREWKLGSLRFEGVGWGSREPRV